MVWIIGGCVLFGRGKKTAPIGDPYWSNDEQAAFEEARRRIHQLISASKPGLFELKTNEFQLFLSDLGALQKIPDSVGDIHNLTEVHLGTARINEQNFSGATQIKNLRPLTKCGSLRSLNISGTAVEDLSPVGCLTELETLDMERTSVRDITVLIKLPRLRAIYLAGSKVADLTPLSQLPARERGEPISFGYKDTPALLDSPALRLLSRLPGEEGREETLSYLSGEHPAFSEAPNGEVKQSPSQRLASASTLDFSINNNAVVAKERLLSESKNVATPATLYQEIGLHLGDLLSEAEAKQLPKDWINRLKRYETAASASEPLFISLESKVSFIEGSLKDAYLIDATDQGFLEGCNRLLQLHNGLRLHFHPQNSYDDVLRESKDVEASLADLEEVGALIAAQINPEVDSGRFGASVDRAFSAPSDYSDAARLDPKRQGSYVKKGLIAFGSLTATLASATAIHSWAVTPQGALVLARLKEILQRIIQLLGLS